MNFLNFLAVGCFIPLSAFAVHSSSPDEIFYADPTIIPANGIYYMAGTQGGSPQGFSILTSSDLKNWETSSVRPNLMEGAGVYGDKGFWAPQFFYDNGKWHILYTANEQVASASASGILGPFSGPSVPVDGSEHNIDPFLFRDDDGKMYLYHVRFNNGNFLWVGEYDIDKGEIIPGTIQQVFSNDQPWENTDAYPCVPIMEGPTVIKLNGTYYLFYSANHFMSPDYAVGYATAPTPVGPWTKNASNPIIHRSIVGEKGAGHGDVFTDNDGKMRYVYHVHNSDSVVSPRRTRIIDLILTPTPETGIPFSITADPTSIIIPTRQ